MGYRVYETKIKTFSPTTNFHAVIEQTQIEHFRFDFPLTYSTSDSTVQWEGHTGVKYYNLCFILKGEIHPCSEELHKAYAPPKSHKSTVFSGTRVGLHYKVRLAYYIT